MGGVKNNIYVQEKENEKSGASIDLFHLHFTFA